MPIIQLKISAPKSPEMTHRIAGMLLDLTSRILHKKPEVTAITIDYVVPEDWIVGGRTLAEQRRHSFFFDIRITDETNTKDEKARYIREAFDAFAGLLGDVHEESYIHVHDVRAASYGYGGRTQEFRYHRPG